METHSILFRFLMMAALVLAVDALGWLFLRRYARISRLARLFKTIHFPLTLLFILSTGTYRLLAGLPGLDPEAYRNFFLITGLFVLIWLPRLAFVLSASLLSLPGLLFREGKKVRMAIASFSLTVMLGMFLVVLYGMLAGTGRFEVRQVEIIHPDIPEGMDGLRIAHFSDTHLGSFFRRQNVEKGVQMIQDQEPDLILFTGDLVNVVAEEAWPYRDAFAGLNAPLGKYAILGNHDISDYVKGDTMRPPEVNRALLRRFYHETGFLLMEDTAVSLSRGADSLILAGIDNWGLPPFRQDGDLERALSFFPGQPTLLLSHDPSHWDAEVLRNGNVFLTLSGHTHGMQMGIRTRWLQWSPSVYVYPRWGGLFEEQGRFLYVNAGFGFIGFPGRIGIPPEITLITLKRG